MTLYLKYRPTDFDSLVGQDFIKNTLRQAIIKDKLVGAYLFCGPRGTGKTSTARIFAKTINCLDLKDGNPCLKCKICNGFLDDNLVDIIEIDAASYTGVDNIREIIEKAVFSPTLCKYKVYIIDEVHMLSKGAFNALLKILEEPPNHLKFILATTESHKIPETILSRCQRYDFKSINDEDLINRLKFIADNEKIKIDQESLDFIVKQSNGGLRNAISLFEQLIYNDEIIFENVVKNYGIPKKDILVNFYNKLILKDESILNDFDEISGNYDLLLFFKELLFYIKDSLILNLKDDEKLSQNILLLETLEDSYIKSKNAFDQKTTFLLGIIKCIKQLNNSLNTHILPTIKKEPVLETKKESPKVEIKNPKVENEIKVNQEISDDDLLDIFGDEDIKPKAQTNIVQDKKINNSNINNSGFDLELFISNLKQLGAKGALTMSLRGSKLNFDDKNLTIYTKTKISLKQIVLSENISFIQQALNQLGFLDINIEVK